MARGIPPGPERKQIMEMNEEPRVEFGGELALPIAAVFAGAAIAIGVPADVLGLGHDLTPQMQMWLTVLAVCFGGFTALIAAFFGTVIPSSVDGGWHGHHNRHGHKEAKTAAAAPDQPGPAASSAARVDI